MEVQQSLLMVHRPSTSDNQWKRFGSGGPSLGIGGSAAAEEGLAIIGEGLTTFSNGLLASVSGSMVFSGDDLSTSDGLVVGSGSSIDSPATSMVEQWWRWWWLITRVILSLNNAC